MSKPLPATCREAAERFREWAADAGDAPIPQAILHTWAFAR